ncbi:YndJ family transporter [Halalkalibacter alkaliphilus]|uniref:YndJ family protein n=1 Tax=Halalkalibacter alkaliphilus TaxID=2917993 RepID=A0A9X2CWX3_9BACI|nr:YndJ family transporter [Halalkalibacter alkaliphilus]MCL7749612.1 YndJ family protein [Halalkalibacter alkaliphilus]
MKHPFFPAIIGGIISFIIFTFDYFQFSLIEKFLMFAFFVISPLTIMLINNKDQTKFQKKIYSFITVLHFPAALLALASLMSNKTWEVGSSAISGSFSLAWLLFTFLLALYGLLLILEKKEKIEEIAIGAGLIYFFIGGIWYTLYQFQLTFLLVDPTVSALSSVHFHFSSAIVPIFIGMLGRIMVKKSWYNWLVIIDIIGPILIAIGIVLSKPLEIFGVSIFACNIIIYSSYLLLKLRKSTKKSSGNLFLTLSSLAFYSIIVLSICYPIAKRYFSLTIMDMVPIYGSLHAFGFVLFGLLGWILMTYYPHKRAN